MANVYGATAELGERNTWLTGRIFAAPSLRMINVLINNYNSLSYASYGKVLVQKLLTGAGGREIASNVLDNGREAVA